MTDFAYDVFLSHSSQDKERVQRLGERLRADGVRVWLDAFEIGPGDHIGLKIEAGLERSRVVLLCMSGQAFGSAWVGAERWAPLFADPANTQRRFVPVLFEKGPIPALLRPYRFVDYTVETEAAYQEILSACREDGRTGGESAADLREPANLRRRARLFPRLACPEHLRGAWG